MCDGECDSKIEDDNTEGAVCTGCGEVLNVSAKLKHFQAEYLDMILCIARKLPLKQRIEFLKGFGGVPSGMP